jgi:hypothetical protein
MEGIVTFAGFIACDIGADMEMPIPSIARPNEPLWFVLSQSVNHLYQHGDIQPTLPTLLPNSQIAL